jgi:hypothetical protein
VRALLADRRTLPDVVAARQMSPGAREALARAGVSWVDETGAAEISLPSLVVSRDGYRQARPRQEPHWTPSALAVAEAILCGTRPTVAETAQVTGLSTAGCAIGLRTLSDLGLLESSAKRGRASGRRVADADRLLDAYADAVSSLAAGAQLRVGLPPGDPIAAVAEIGKTWSKSGIPWAATGAVAAAMLAPYLTSVNTAEVYVGVLTEAELRQLVAKGGLRPIAGGRLLLRALPVVTTIRLATTNDGLRLAPWPRVYADLRGSGVRGEEAAEHLREVVHGT